MTCQEVVKKLTHEIKKLEEDRNSLPKAGEEDREKELNGEITRRETLIDEINNCIEEKITPIFIPFVVAAMNSEEALQLENGEVFNSDEVAPAICKKFKVFQNEFNCENWCSCYKKARDHWIPSLNSTDSIGKLIDKMSEKINDSKSDIKIFPVSLSEDFFSEEENKRQKSLDELEHIGIVIVDTISLFHPRVAKILLEDAQLGGNRQTAIVTISPCIPESNTIPESLQSHISEKMNWAVAKFKNKCDLLYWFEEKDYDKFQWWFFNAFSKLLRPFEKGGFARPENKIGVEARTGGPQTGIHNSFYG